MRTKVAAILRKPRFDDDQFSEIVDAMQVWAREVLAAQKPAQAIVYAKQLRVLIDYASKSPAGPTRDMALLQLGHTWGEVSYRFQIGDAGARSRATKTHADVVSVAAVHDKVRQEYPHWKKTKQWDAEVIERLKVKSVTGDGEYRMSKRTLARRKAAAKLTSKN